jgi:glycosyltransferase involved in cell wall biosynthesis
MILSVIILTIPERVLMLKTLLETLQPQLTGECELLVIADNGQKTIGAKRQEGLWMARGKYVCFIDDDDTVSEDYVSKILKAIETNPDCCGIEGQVTFNGNNPKKFIQSINSEIITFNSFFVNLLVLCE